MSEPAPDSSILTLLRVNQNYRNLWIGQVVSEVGDHFNNIAVFSLALAYTGTGMAVAGVMLARAIPVLFAGPLAGVTLDRLDRRMVMICSDLLRALVALGFIAALYVHDIRIVYVFSALLMFASPFFTSGRSAILPSIARREELHPANALTQTTAWMTTAIGAFLGGESVARFGYQGAFILNSVSFIVSAFCVSRLRLPEGFRVMRLDAPSGGRFAHVADYVEGLRYMWSIPLIFGIGLLGAGWAMGGGAAQILFTLFGEVVFHSGPQGIGVIWGCAGIGLVLGGTLGHQIGNRLKFKAYKNTIIACYLVHGLAYVAFSRVPSWYSALFLIGLSRAAVAVSSVLNTSQVLKHVGNEYRGRVFATIETMIWTVMMISLGAAGVASQTYSPRNIGTCAGIFSSVTGVLWAWANWSGRLPDPSTSRAIHEPEIVMEEAVLDAAG